jgi:flagellar biosynthesis/type III secretory pathway M-ring protein FliF/YscJ
MTWTLTFAALVRADEPVNPEQQQALISGALPIAGIFVLALLIALFVLWKSMNRQMRKIDSSLPAGRDDQEQALDRRLTQEAVARGERAAADAPSDPSVDSKDDTGS